MISQNNQNLWENGSSRRNTSQRNSWKRKNTSTKGKLRSWRNLSKKSSKALPKENLEVKRRKWNQSCKIWSKKNIKASTPHKYSNNKRSLDVKVSHSSPSRKDTTNMDAKWNFSNKSPINDTKSDMYSAKKLNGGDVIQRCKGSNKQLNGHEGNQVRDLFTF